MSGRPWDALGIAPTADASDIRRAYARRLKAIDVDADPRAFIALREARDAATALAGRLEPAVELFDEEAEAPLDAEREEEPGPDPTAQGPAIEERMRAIEALLAGDGGAARAEELFAQLDALLADPQLERIDLLTEVERRIAHLLASAVPRSDPLLRPVAERMGWLGPASGPGQPPEIAFVVGRALALGEGPAVEIEPDLKPEPQDPRAGPGDGRPGPSSARTQDYDALYRGIWELLLPDNRGDAASEDDRIRVFGEAFEAIVADPRMAEIGFHADAERWFSEVLARAIPLSDPVVTEVARHFGWIERAQEVGVSPAIAALADRVRLQRFLTDVSDPRRRFHGAWLELNRPADTWSWRRLWEPRQNVTDLLALVRREFPEVEERYFDPLRIARLEGPRKTPLQQFLIAVSLGWLGLVVLGAIVAAFDDRPSQPSVGTYGAPNREAPPMMGGALTDPRSELDAALRSVSDGTVGIAEVERRNPALDRDLRQLWTSLRDSGRNSGDLTTAVHDRLRQRFFEMRRKAGYAPLAAAARVKLERARLYRDQSWDSCDAFVHSSGEGGPPIPADLRRRQTASLFRLLLETQGDPPEPPKEKGFRVPGAVVRTVMQKTGLSEDAVADTFRGAGTAQTRCAVEIALGEAALALPPKQGLPLLRGL